MNWLRTQQRSDGAWGWDDRLTIRDTTEVLQALAVLAPEDSSLTSGRDALSVLVPVGVDQMARQLHGLRKETSEILLAALISDLVSARTPDGGWGSAHGFGASDALDTALALRALIGTGDLTNDALLQAKNRLSALQNSDGGFGLGAAEASDLGTSAEVLLAVSDLARVFEAGALRASLGQFLLSQQLTDGGFPRYAGDQLSDVRTTSLVVRAMIEAGVSTAPAFLSARSYLEANQLGNGSWNDSPYTTAMALMAFGNARPDLIVHKVELSPMTALRGAEVKLTATIANVGVADAPSAAVYVYLGDPNAGGSLQRRLSTATIPGGGLTTLNTTVTTALTVESTLAYFVVVDPNDQIPESCETNNRGSATVKISGVFLPPADQGPTITSTPPRRATVGTVYTYQIEAVDPEGDTIWYNSLFHPPGWQVDPRTGLVTWPVNVPAGTRVVAEVGALDWNFAGDAQSITIEVMAPGVTWPPVIESFPTSSAVVGQTYLYAIDARDPDGGPVTLTLAAGPPGMTINQATKVLSWTPTAGDTGDNIVRIVATDSENATAEQQWVIVVAPLSSLKPDLAVIQVDPSLAPADPQTLQREGAVMVSIVNQGNAPAGAFSVTVYENRDGLPGYDPAGDTKLGTAMVDSLSINTRTDVVVVVSGKSLFRDNRLTAVADAENIVEELREDNNEYGSGEETRFVPTPAPFSLSVKKVLAMPGAAQYGAAIAPLQDDNGDGHVGAGDTRYAVARQVYETKILNGRSGAIAATIQCSSHIAAIGDVNRDGYPEIFCSNSVRRLQAYDHNGVKLWESADASAGNEPLVLYDLEGDGIAEIISGLGITAADGVLRCSFNYEGIGASDSTPIVGDFDLDGVPEIIVSGFAFRPDCSTKWAHSELGQAFGQAAGQLDDDPQAEIAVTNNKGLWLLEHDGTIKWLHVPESGYTHTGTYVGPPAVGDVNGDGKAEVVYGDRSEVQAVGADGITRWKYGVNALAGQVAPTLADLDGDGKVEVIYRGDALLAVLRGSDGWLLDSYDSLKGNTGFVQASVADIDDDGHVEIIINSAGDPYGLLVFGNPNWAPGRGIWNQHTYHITNINDDLTIPRKEPPSWQVSNTYRAQQTIAKPICNGPDCEGLGTADLTASFIRVDRSLCPSSAKYTVRIGNAGTAWAKAGVKVKFTRAAAGGNSELGTALTTKALAPGQYEDVSLTTAGTSDNIQLTVTVDPDQEVADGRRENNLHRFSFGACASYDNRSPLFVTTPPLVAYVGREWIYSPYATDPDGDAVAFELTTAPAGMIGPSSSGAIVWTPTLAQLGQQSVSLKVSDARGGLDVQSFEVNVVPPELVSTPVLPVADLGIQVATDKTTYGPSQTVAMTAILQNMAPSGRSGEIRIEVQDASGLSIATPLETRSVLFTGAATQTFAATFDTGVLLVGTYKVFAVYREGSKESRAEASFAVSENPSLVASVVTERQIYAVGETVRISGSITNAGTNTVLTGVVPTLLVLDSEGTELRRQQFEEVELGPTARSRPEMLFEIGQRPPGEYLVRLEVAQATIATVRVDARFSVASTAQRGQALAGEITADPTSVNIGDPFAISGTLTNVGNAALTGLDVRMQVVNPASGQAVREQSSLLDLSVNASAPVAATWSSLGLRPQSYIARLEAKLGDRSLLSVATELVVEPGPPPVVTVEVPTCGREAAMPSIHVSGGAPPVAQVAILDGQPYSGGEIADEGAHVLEVEVTDSIGRTATAKASFVIDRTVPAVSITGVMDGAAYPAGVVPSVLVSDAHLVATQALLNGAEFASGTEIDADGSYSLTASARDCAGNQTTLTTTFVVDRVPPQIAIDVPACSAGVVTPVVTVVEDHVALDERLLDEKPWDGSAVTSEGKHTLKVAVVDSAGNVATRSVDFTVDNTAPTIVLTGVESGKAYNAPVVPTVVFQDAVAISLVVNDRDFISGTTISDDGKYQLKATATDCAGNRAAFEASFSIDTVSPVISIDVDACQPDRAAPVVTVTESNLATDVRLLDGQAWDGAAVTEEGKHTIEVTVTDVAGNRTEKSASFVVDRTPPAVLVTGVTDGGWYRDPVTPVVTIEDANLVSSTIELDETPFQSGSTVESAGSHTLTVSATDCAGNKGSASVNFALDFTPPLLTLSNIPVCTSAAEVLPEVTADEPVTLEGTLDDLPYVPGEPIGVEGTHILKISATDRAGNVSVEERILTIDRLPPQILLTGVDNGGAYRSAVTPAISISDANLGATSVFLDGMPYLDQSPIGTEGSHVLSIQATDCGGNSADMNVAFLIDLSAPTVSISGIAGCASGPARPVVSASDINEPAWAPSRHCVLDGQALPSCDDLTIASEGVHHLVATATDRAANTSPPYEMAFTVDDTAPSIAISGISDGAAYGHAVNPSISVVEQNLTSSNVTLNGQLFQSGTPVIADGWYTLSAEAADCAGHRTLASATFLVDTLAPVVTVTAPACSAGEVNPEISVTELNLLSDTRTLDGAEFQNVPVSLEGTHLLTVTAKDRAGNEGTGSVQFIIDRSAPVLRVEGVEDGQRYINPVTPVIVATDINLAGVSITLNGAAFESGTTVSAEGPYTLATTVSDCAGNRTTDTRHFEIRPVAGALSHSLSYGSRVLLATECAGCAGPQVLHGVLADLAIPYEEADGRLAWLAKLRSGRFNQVILRQPLPDESGSALQELAESVWMGDGLLVFKNSPDAMPGLRESLGLDFGGLLPHLNQAVLVEPLQPAQVATGGNAVKLKLSGATGVGFESQGGSVAVAGLNGRGLGKALTLSWNTEMSLSPVLYRSALAAAGPAPGTPLQAGGTAEVRTIVHNTGAVDATYQVVHTLASGLSTSESLESSIAVPAGESRQLATTLRLPPALGDYAVAGKLLFEGAVLDTNSFVLNVTIDGGSLKNRLVAKLQGLVLKGGEREKRNRAVSLLEQAAQATSPGAALTLVLQSISEVRGISSVDITEIRIDLARLLRSYQMEVQP